MQTIAEERRRKGIHSFFQEEAAKWDVMTRRYEPRYDEMLNEVILRTDIPIEQCKILDLGCGTGNLARLFLDKYPRVHVVCVDASSQMLDMAAVKLSSYGSRVTLLERDFFSLPEDLYHAVVSSLALHHIGSDPEKQNVYRSIYGVLTSGGFFWNADITLCSDEKDSLRDENSWRKWLGQNAFSEDEIDQIIERSHSNDRPAVLLDQLMWLKEIGFRYVDCTWRYMGYAVYGGRKLA